jgi:hypothetical protein
MKHRDNFTFFKVEVRKTPSKTVINIVTEPSLGRVNSFGLRLLYPPQIRALIHTGREKAERI